MHTAQMPWVNPGKSEAITTMKEAQMLVSFPRIHSQPSGSGIWIGSVIKMLQKAPSPAVLIMYDQIHPSSRGLCAFFFLVQLSAGLIQASQRSLCLTDSFVQPTSSHYGLSLLTQAPFKPPSLSPPAESRLQGVKHDSVHQ